MRPTLDVCQPDYDTACMSWRLSFRSSADPMINCVGGPIGIDNEGRRSAQYAPPIRHIGLFGSINLDNLDIFAQIGFEFIQGRHLLCFTGNAHRRGEIHNGRHTGD